MGKKTLKEFEVTVTQTVKVTLDESHFTPEFNEVFSECFWKADDIEDHAMHLAQMEARSLIGFDKFVEGYGDIRAMGITVQITDQSEEVESQKEVCIEEVQAL